MSEKDQPKRPNLPPGILSAEQYLQSFSVDESVLPWVNGSHEFSIIKCDVGDDTKFLLGSVVDSHKRLEEAASSMSDHQRGITDNMFYSRIAAFMQHGQATSVDTMPNPSTGFPIHVMRNKGGQRVYFAVPNLVIEKGKPAQPVVLRLGVCDKNKQSLVMKVLSGASSLEKRKKTSK